ncbi:hypothetical protein J0H58_33215 [bacterium]|nr:hypothetical protein [bacterium]
MPIRFRCPHCNRLLGIATRKAGTEIACPQCGVSVSVPRPVGSDAPAARELDEIDALLGHSAGSNGVFVAEVAPPAVPAPPPRPHADPVRPPAVVAPKPAPPAPAKKKSGDSLFENDDVDALLGLPSPLPPPAEDTAPRARPKGGPKPVTGMDVQSLDGGDGTWVMSPQKVSLLVVGVALLLLVAFGGGFLVASLL